MKTSQVLLLWFLIGITVSRIYTLVGVFHARMEQVDAYERELIRASDEIRELEEENANWRKQIESMQMYIDMNINPQFYTVDVESDEKMGEF